MQGPVAPITGRSEIPLQPSKGVPSWLPPRKSAIVMFFSIFWDWLFDFLGSFSWLLTAGWDCQSILEQHLGVGPGTRPNGGKFTGTSLARWLDRWLTEVRPNPNLKGKQPFTPVASHRGDFPVRMPAADSLMPVPFCGEKAQNPGLSWFTDATREAPWSFWE